MTRPLSRRWPLDPVLDYVKPDSLAEFSRVYDIDNGELHRWKRDGMTRHTAERLCDALRAHPLWFWPEFYDADVEALHVECEASDCTVRFIPSKPGVQRFCTPRCRRRERMRRYRATPHGRATALKWSAVWYEQNRDQVIADKRQFRAKYPDRLKADNARWRANKKARAGNPPKEEVA